MQVTAHWSQVEFSGDWGLVHWRVREDEKLPAEADLGWAPSAGPVPMEGMGSEPDLPLCHPDASHKAQLYFPICESLRPLLLLSVLGFSLVGCKKSQGVWSARLGRRGTVKVSGSL